MGICYNGYVKPYLWMKMMRSRVERRRAKWVVTTVLAAIYFVVAKFGLSLAHTTRQITAVWPASGLALVVLLVLGYSYWPAIAIGAFAANWSDNEPLLVALAIAGGNALEAMAGAWIVRRLGQGGSRMETPSGSRSYRGGGVIGLNGGSHRWFHELGARKGDSLGQVGGELDDVVGW